MVRLLDDKEGQDVVLRSKEAKTINLGGPDNVKEVRIGTQMAELQRKELVGLLKEYQDVFAWSYKDMPGLDTDIVVHRIPLRSEVKPIKQKLRRMKPELQQKVRDEVVKMFEAGLIEVAQYPEWVANIVLVPKKNGKVRMCVDFRDLNKASSKDNFPLPHIDMLVDNTTGFTYFSFMDGFSGYN